MFLLHICTNGCISSLGLKTDIKIFVIGVNFMKRIDNLQNVGQFLSCDAMLVSSISVKFGM